MKKFKLIKIYPGSMPAGTIFEQYKNDDLYHAGKQYNTSWTTRFFTENPEYYQELIQSDEGDLLLMNKRCLSLEDVKKHHDGFLDNTLEQLKKLVNAR